MGLHFKWACFGSNPIYFLMSNLRFLFISEHSQIFLKKFHIFHKLFLADNEDNDNSEVYDEDDCNDDKMEDDKNFQSISSK